MKQLYPKIGIRPIIDGRRGGIRESLEETTMNLSRSAARLYSENLRYPDGTPVECIMADTCIGGVFHFRFHPAGVTVPKPSILRQAITILQPFILQCQYGIRMKLY